MTKTKWASALRERGGALLLQGQIHPELSQAAR
jgi:hypothetical protein